MKPDGVGNGTPLVYSKDFSRLECRLFAHDPGSLDLLQAPKRVGDAPMPRFELHCLFAQVRDVDGVSPEKIAIARRRPLRDEAGRDGDFNLAGYGAIHLYAAQLTSPGLAIRSMPRIMAESLHERKAAHGPGFDRTRSPA